MNRRTLLAVLFAPAFTHQSMAGSEDPAIAVLSAWFRLALRLVRHTATYSPPVASRAFAYLGVAAYESVAAGNSHMRTLAGQLNGFEALPPPGGRPIDTATVLHYALSGCVSHFFSNTGPTGKRTMSALEKKLVASLGEPPLESQEYGRRIAQHVLAWAETDGGAVVENMGFPASYKLSSAKGAWVPTSTIALQQAPLLPTWGNNRSFAMPASNACKLPSPPAYSEERDSAFFKEALEVYEISKSLTEEQIAIARFWSDDPMLSPTPAGHWISIAMQIMEEREATLAVRAGALARLGVAMADAFIACWRSKYEFDLLRPVTYIRHLIDPQWEPLLITPPFPEYPSGHSTQSAAAAEVLTRIFGDNVGFTDTTHERDGFPARSFKSFYDAANEAAISRLYGGIHFRAAIDRGIEQGKCVGSFANALEMQA
jgi:hypothetical protein